MPPLHRFGLVTVAIPEKWKIIHVFDCKIYQYKYHQRIVDISKSKQTQIRT